MVNRVVELVDVGHDQGAAETTSLLRVSQYASSPDMAHLDEQGCTLLDAQASSAAVVLVEDDDFAVSATFKFSWRKLWRFMGPGFLMSIAYMDPGNLESDLQAGAQTGYVLLWLIVFTTGLGFIVQMQSAKLGVVTGRHLAEHCRSEFPPVPSKALWLMAEIAIIGSDIQEVIGCAIAIAILSQGYIPLWAGVLITTIDSFLLLYIERWGVRYLEAFFATLIGIMAITFGVMYEKAGVTFSDVAGGLFVPSLPRFAVPTAVALMGSLIMPHNIYLHSALVQTRGLSTQSALHKREALVYFGLESALSLLAAVLINLFVVAVFARGFYNTPDAEGIGLQNAGEFLGKQYGVAVKYIWALGLLAAGQSSTMTGTYTGQFVMSGYLDLKVSPWLRVIITRGVAICPTLLVAIIYRGHDSQLDVVNQALNLLQSVQLPFALIPVLTFASSRRIMGDFSNAWYTSAATWSTALLVMVINVIGVFDVLSEAVFSKGVWAIVLVASVALIYFLFIAYLVIGPRRFDILLSRVSKAAGGRGGPGRGGWARPAAAASPLLPSVVQRLVKHPDGSYQVLSGDNDGIAMNNGNGTAEASSATRDGCDMAQLLDAALGSGAAQEAVAGQLPRPHTSSNGTVELPVSMFGAGDSTGAAVQATANPRHGLTPGGRAVAVTAAASPSCHDGAGGAARTDSTDSRGNTAPVELRRAPSDREPLMICSSSGAAGRGQLIATAQGWQD